MTMIKSAFQSDKEILSLISINIDDLKSVGRRKRTYYRNVIQCLCKCRVMSDQELIDNYLESIMYLCKTKDFEAIQVILNTTISLNPNFPETVVPLSEYLLIKGFHIKLIAVCEDILNSFDSNSTDLLEIDFLFTKGKAGIVDRVTGHQLFWEFQKNTQTNSLLYLQSQVRLAHSKLNIGQYKDSLAGFKKISTIVQSNLLLCDTYKIHELQADILEGMARLAMIDNNWQDSLLLYEQLADICKKQNFMPKFVNCLGHQGVINRKIKKYNIALEYFEEARQIAIKIDSPRAIEWIDHHTAYVFLNKGKYNLAEKLAEKCLVKAISEKRDNEAGDFYEQLGLIKLGKNKISKAIENLELSLFFRKKVGNHHGTASSHKHLCLAYFAHGQYIEACISIKECLLMFYKLKVLGFRRTYRIAYLIWEWTMGSKRWTS